MPILRAEVLHEHTRAQERQRRGFKPSGHAQRFLSVHGKVHILFRVGRHLLSASRTIDFEEQVSCAC
jgi:hypothetical protein